MSELFTTVDVSQFGADDSTIDRYKQAGEYALESQLYAAKTKEMYDQLKNDVFITDSVLAAETAAAQANISSDEAQSAAQTATEAALNAATDATNIINVQLNEQAAEFEQDQAQRELEFEQTRLNLIPLGKQYNTLAQAQADIANIPVNSYVYVRSSDASALADEYVNTAGTLVATGKKMPSQVEVSSLKSGLTTEVAQRRNLIQEASSDSYIFYIDDKEGREVFGLSATDGGPTPHTSEVWLNSFKETTSIPIKRNIPGFSYAFVSEDEDGQERMTELSIQSSNGQFPDFVLEAWAERLGPMLEDKINFPVKRPTPAGTWEHPSGDLVPYQINLTTIVGLGSSSTSRSRLEYAQMAADFGASYKDMGWSGGVLNQNAANIGSRPALITVTGGTIPASGPVSVVSSNMTFNNAVKPFQGTLLGVHGTLSWVSGTTGQFERTVAGSSLVCPTNTPFIPDDRKYRENFVILESGKNDINVGRGAQAIIDDTLSVVNYMAPFVPTTVVVGHFANGNYNANQRNILATINANINSTYGNRAVDQQAWLTSATLWDQLSAEGVTPTADDLADQANGDVPRSLMTSARDHLTTPGYHYRMKYLIKPKLIELGLYRG